MHRLSYVVKVYDILSQRDIKKYNITLISISKGDSATQYELLAQGDSKYRRQFKRYFWTKIFYILQPYFHVITKRQWEQFRKFYAHCTWIDESSIILDADGHLSHVPNLFYRLLREKERDDKTSSFVRTPFPPRNQQSSTEKTTYFLEIGFQLFFFLSILLFLIVSLDRTYGQPYSRKRRFTHTEGNPQCVT